MTLPTQDTDVTHALRGLEADRSAVRLRAAMAAGTTPDPGSSESSSNAARSNPTSRCARCSPGR